jgi:hypothetical protein
MMRALAHQALSLKQPHHCVDLVEAALRRGLGRVDGQTEALLHITHARAYAATHENPSAARALLAAGDGQNHRASAKGHVTPVSVGGTTS